MRIAVTGATGHLGANLLPLLCERGAAIRVLVTGADSRLAPLRGLDVEVVRGDVRDPAALERTLRGADLVFHLAARISIDGDRDGQVRSVNVGGTQAVTAAARDCGVGRLVHCSSVHALNQKPLDRAVDESRDRVTESPRYPAYDRSKAAGEQVVERAVEQGLDAVIVRPVGMIGPADHRGSHMGRFFDLLARGRIPALVSGGFTWADVRDVGRGLLAAAERGRRGESYLLGGHWHSVRELAHMAHAVTGVTPPRCVLPLGLARLVAPGVAWIDRKLGRPLTFTPDSMTALGANRDISDRKARQELDYVCRPTEQSVRDFYGWLAGQRRQSGAAATRRDVA